MFVPWVHLKIAVNDESGCEEIKWLKQLILEVRTTHIFGSEFQSDVVLGKSPHLTYLMCMWEGKFGLKKKTSSTRFKEPKI